MNKDEEFNDWLCEREDGIGYSSFDKRETADEMFEKLGYKKGEIGIFIQFNNIKESISITFNTKEKTVSKCKGYDEAIPITDKELQAIIKKVEELRRIK